MNKIINKKTAFVIAHYHKDGLLSRHVIDHIKYISKLTENIVFVSTCLSNDSRLELEEFASVIVRANYGYDFWSYKLGLDCLGDLNNIDHVIFWNSSFICVDPRRLYLKYMANIERQGFYGITSCKNPSLHIQSYFFSFFGKDLIRSDIFRKWWELMVPISKREDVIAKYEIGMSQFFLNHGVTIHQVFNTSLLDNYRILKNLLSTFKLSYLIKLLNLLNSRRIVDVHSLNLTHFAWEIILKRFGIIKLELLKNNPNSLDLKKISQVLSKKELFYVDEGLR